MSRQFYKKKPYNSFRQYNSQRYSSNYKQNDDYKMQTKSKWVTKDNINTQNKDYYRNKVWNYMENNNIALFPRPVYHRIPNFIGNEKASMNLLKIEEFINAKLVKINPDKPQVRFYENID